MVGAWKVMVGHGRSWKVMEDHRRSWKVMEGRGRSWKVMEGHLLGPVEPRVVPQPHHLPWPHAHLSSEGGELQSDGDVAAVGADDVPPTVGQVEGVAGFEARDHRLGVGHGGVALEVDSVDVDGGEAELWVVIHVEIGRLRSGLGLGSGLGSGSGVRVRVRG